MNKVVIVTQEMAGVRLDKLLKTLFPEKSRTAFLADINDGFVKVNSLFVKASYITKIGDTLEIEERELKEIDLTPTNLNLDIIYQDEDVAVVYKPEGLVVHPSSGTVDPTLVNGLLYEIDDLSGIKGSIRPGIVHRIDKDTSGLLMIAKNDVAAENLSNQLKNHTVNRLYYALVYGVIEEDKGRIEAPIARDTFDRKKMCVSKDGKYAVTNFVVLKRFKKFTFIECKLETGRTHQIRVHMKYIGHPLVGDRAYGPKRVIGEHGQLLHAGVLGFTHPKTNEFLEFKSDLPDYFKLFLEELAENEK